MLEIVGRDRYFAYLRSSSWQRVRRRELHRAGYVCEDCSVSNVPLHVHHLTYERLGLEAPGDLRVLCAVCHEARHDGLERDPCAPAWVKENPWLARILKTHSGLGTQTDVDERDIPF